MKTKLDRLVESKKDVTCKVSEYSDLLEVAQAAQSHLATNYNRVANISDSGGGLNDDYWATRVELRKALAPLLEPCEEGK
jgi:hypothetical protein